MAITQEAIHTHTQNSLWRGLAFRLCLISQQMRACLHVGALCLLFFPLPPNITQAGLASLTSTNYRAAAYRKCNPRMEFKMHKGFLPHFRLPELPGVDTGTKCRVSAIKPSIIPQWIC